MSHNGLPPPAPACLWRPYSSNPKCKGGTLIVEDVSDRETHERRLCVSDGYRPAWCAGCGHQVLHVHDYPERKLRAEPLDPERPAGAVRIIRYECAACGGIWRVLPGFLARHLWRSWPVVEVVTIGAPPPSNQPEVPERTQRRWAARLLSSGALLVQMLATSVQAALVKIAKAIGLAPIREAVVHEHASQMGLEGGRKLAALAALIHRLAPGVRLV